MKERQGKIGKRIIISENKIQYNARESPNESHAIHLKSLFRE